MNLSAIRDRLAASTVRWAPTRMYASAVGWGAQRTLPRALRAPLYAAFARVVGADLDEVEHPLADYACFGAFFARGLRAGARQLDPDAQAVVAPCDGTVGASGRIEEGMLLQAKGHRYALAELVASTELAEVLEGGSYLTIYLAPRDYHRVHAPVAGKLAACHHVPGALLPVSERFTSAVPRLFARNERVIAQLDTEHGPAVLVLVAAVGVGNVALRDESEALVPLPRHRRPRQWQYDDAPQLARGDAVGAFQLGSTVIALFSDPGYEISAPPIGSPIRFGERIGRLADGRNDVSQGPTTTSGTAPSASGSLMEGAT